MCGIAGFLNISEFDVCKRDLREAATRLSHRGPDDAGFFYDDSAGIGLAHRRLSIIDLSDAAHQPFSSADKRVQLVFNGEIYNFKKIRKELMSLGHRFRSDSDTEVILHAYLEWGISSIEKLSGMFAIALWDANLHQLFLARDRLGIKPLYYYQNNDVLLFASELKALQAFKLFEREVDTQSLSLYLHYQYVPTPYSIFKNCRKLEPGCILQYNEQGLRIAPYWEHPHIVGPHDPIVNEATAVESLDQALTRSVQEHLISDVPLGALLSGGVDSSLIVALMQKVSTSPVKTFTIGFDNKQYDESPWARQIAEHLGTEHQEIITTPRETLEIIPSLPEIYDEPFGDSSAVPTCLISRLIRSQVKVALSGDGGDEQFAGYVRYWSTNSLVKWLERIPVFLEKNVHRCIQKVPSNWVEKCYLPAMKMLPQRFQTNNFLKHWHNIGALSPDSSIADIYRLFISLWSKVEIQSLINHDLPHSRYDDLFEITQHLPLFSRLMAVDQLTYLPDAMLTKTDRASMSVGLEIRVPFLDHNIVALSTKMDEKLKYQQGKGKYILRQLLSKYLPQSLFERPKKGFSLPLGQWFRSDLKELLNDYLSPSTIKKEGLFNAELVEQKILEHNSGRFNHQHQLWILLMWEMWRERWL